MNDEVLNVLLAQASYVIDKHGTPQQKEDWQRTVNAIVALMRETYRLRIALQPLVNYDIAAMTTADVWGWLDAISQQAREAAGVSE